MGRSDASGWLWRNRWMMLVAGVWVMCSSGTSYLYSDYSSAIKETLHYDQETLDTVGFFKELGESVGLLSGLLYDVFPMWAVLLIGGVQLSGGYLMAYLAVAGTLTAPPVWAMSLFLCVGANGQTFFITATLVSVVKRFPMSRGMVIGIMKGLIGLSAAVLSQFSKAVYPHSDPGKSVLLFLSWFPVSVVALAYLFFRSQPTEADSCAVDAHSDVVEYEESEPLYFSVFAGAMLSLAAFLMGIIMLQHTVGVFPASLSRGVAVVTLLLLLLPLGIVYVSHFGNRNNNNNNSGGTVVEPLLVQSSEPENSPLGSSTTITRIDSFQREFPARGEDHTLLQALQNADFWLLVAIAVIGMGSGLTAMDNVGQVGASLGYSPSAVSSFVSLLSIWNFLGRLGAGAVSELALHERGLPRPLFVTGALATMALGHSLLALAFPGALYVGSVLIGVSYGAHWSLVPTATSELFGLRHFGTLLNAVTMASPLGSYFFSVRVAGYFYDVEAHKQHPPIHSALAILHQSNYKETVSCTGAVCFRSAFFIMATICTLGCALSALLLARTRKYYTELYDSRQLRTHHSLRPDMEQPPSSN